jgi:hypothetical protein
MTERDAEIDRKLADLDGRLRELEALQELTLRLLSIRKPLDSILEHHGATASQQQAFYHLLDEMVLRSRGPEHDQPQETYFQSQVEHIFHSLREDPSFAGLLIDTLRIDRPVYRELHAYMVARGWVK